MSGPAYVVIPVQGDEQDNAEIASAVQQSLQQNGSIHPQHHTEEHNGPLKEMLDHQDSLYKYLSWEDPIRTIFSYIIALSILLGAHYLPLTQLALKGGAITLGVVSVTEFASRSFGSDGVLARLRPKQYRKVPESTLNATLKDIHDLVQYSVNQAQRVLFGQDLDKTFAAFLGCTALFWSIKFLSPLSLAVLSLTSLFTAPLVFSPRGRAAAHDAKARAGELTNAAVDTGKGLAQDGKAKVAEQSSRAQETVKDTGRRVGDMAQSGKQTAADLSAQAEGSASDVAGRVPDTGRGLKDTAIDASNEATRTVQSALRF